MNDQLEFHNFVNSNKLMEQDTDNQILIYRMSRRPKHVLNCGRGRQSAKYILWKTL